MRVLSKLCFLCACAEDAGALKVESNVWVMYSPGLFTALTKGVLSHNALPLSVPMTGIGVPIIIASGLSVLMNVSDLVKGRGVFSIVTVSFLVFLTTGLISLRSGVCNTSDGFVKSFLKAVVVFLPTRFIVELMVLIRSPDEDFFNAKEGVNGGRRPLKDIGRVFVNADGALNCDGRTKGITEGGRIRPGNGIRDTPGMGNRDCVGSYNR